MGDIAAHIAHPRVFLLPWLAYGHISPYLELAKKLSGRGFYIYLCSTPINLDSIHNKITKLSSSHPSIQTVEFHLPSLPELPPQHHTTNGLPRHLIPTLRQALKMAKTNLSNLLKALNPDLIIHDPLIPWVAALAAEHNIPSLRFLTASAAAVSYFCHVSRHPAIEYPFPAYSNLRGFEKDIVHRMVAALSGQRDSEDEIFPQRSFGDIMLIKSSREIEGKYIDHLSHLLDTKVVPVGPLVEDPVCGDEQDENIELIQWLGKKIENSTVFMSFGSEYYLKREEIEEIAFGLELSKANFIWAIRFPKGESISVDKALPEGFLERTGERGRVVDGWVPQAKILSHPSIGGFASHCGWSSTLESLGFGIPLIAMPMHLDQPLNAKLMVEIGVAVEVLRDENGKLQRKEIAKVLNNVILGTMAEKLRKQVRDTRERVKMREKEDMKEACNSLAQICENSAGN